MRLLVNTCGPARPAPFSLRKVSCMSWRKLWNWGEAISSAEIGAAGCRRPSWPSCEILRIICCYYTANRAPSLDSPQGVFGNLQALRGGPDGSVKALGIAGIAGRGFQSRYLALPEAIEFEHQHFAQILAEHGGQGHTEMGGIGAGLEGHTDGSVQTQHFVHAPAGAFLPRQHQAIRQGVLDHGTVLVAAAVLVDHKRHGVVI